MTHLIAFDGNEFAAATLCRAVEFAEAAGTNVVAASVVPAGRPLAETYDLVEDGEYDPEAAAERLRSSAHSVAPGCAFRARRVDPYAGKGRIAAELSHVVREVDADVVLVGSKNAGRIVESVSSVGSSVADGTDYDVPVVRSPDR